MIILFLFNPATRSVSGITHIRAQPKKSPPTRLSSPTTCFPNDLFSTHDRKPSLPNSIHALISIQSGDASNAQKEPHPCSSPGRRRVQCPEGTTPMFQHRLMTCPISRNNHTHVPAQTGGVSNIRKNPIRAQPYKSPPIGLWNRPPFVQMTCS